MAPPQSTEGNDGYGSRKHARVLVEQAVWSLGNCEKRTVHSCVVMGNTFRNGTSVQI